MAENSITYENLILSTYALEHIMSLTLTKEANEHAVLHVIAVLSEEQKEEYIYTTGALTPITLEYKMEDGNQEVLFRGVVTSLQVQREGDVYYMDLYAYDNTCLMDIMKNSRSFQDTGMTIHKLINTIMEGYPGGAFKLEIPDEPIGKLTIQYRETDWEFLKRITSRYGAVLIPDVIAERLAYFVGVPEEVERYHADSFRYTMSKSIDEYLRIKQNKWTDVNEIDFIVFQIQDTRIFQVGDYVELQEKGLVVKNAQHVLFDGILNNKYLLKRKNGFKNLESYNSEIIGASITGYVCGVARDKVMVDLVIDGAGKAAYWFPYSTMSASPDGSGWYCMPEKGDQVRVYFPTGDESEAYAVSSVSGHQPGAGASEDPMGNPNVKYLQTSNDQVIKFQEDGIVINSGSGQATIFLGNQGDVTLYGTNNVNVTAKETLSLISQGQLLLGAQNSVKLKKGEGASIELDSGGNITIKGTKVFSN